MYRSNATYKFIPAYRKLFLIVLVLGLQSIASAQPANDNCSFSEDISDRQWHAGNNINASANCGTDINTTNCKPPYQTTDMCCGFDGVESSVFFNFTIPSNDLVFIDFRNIVCNPVNYFGITTALQGFVFSEAGCVTVDNSTIHACFNASSAADVNGQMSFNAVGGQLYQIMIDTKKNSLTSCGSGCLKATNCHSTCNWEIRLRTNTVTKLQDFNLSVVNSSVHASWIYDYEDNYTAFRIKRKKLADNSVELVSEGPVDNFYAHAFNFQYTDRTLDENGLYTYYLEASLGSTTFEPILNKTVFVGYIDDIDVLLLPNPAKDDLKISVTNMKDGKASYALYSALGDMVATGFIESPMQHSIVDISLYPKGIYYVKVIIGNNVISKKLILN